MRVTLLARMASLSQPDNVGCLWRLSARPRGYKLKWRVDTSFIGAKSLLSRADNWSDTSTGRRQRGIMIAGLGEKHFLKIEKHGSHC